MGRLVGWSVDKWSVVGWLVVGGSVVGGLNKTLSFHNLIFNVNINSWKMELVIILKLNAEEMMVSSEKCRPDFASCLILIRKRLFHQFVFFSVMDELFSVT